MSYLHTNKKRPNIKWPVTVLYDDREKTPWDFLPSTFFVTKRVRLKTGDYTLAGFEDTIAIERKSGFEEFIQNISGSDRNRFRQTLVRLSVFKYKFIVIEDSINNLQAVINNLPAKARITFISVLYWITLIETKYGIPIVFTTKKPSVKKLIIEYLFKGIIEALKNG